MKKIEKRGGGEGAKEDAQEKTGSQLVLQMHVQLMREIRRQKDAPASISTASLRTGIEKVADKDEAWLKRAWAVFDGTKRRGHVLRPPLRRCIL